MANHLRVLIVEDREDDALLVTLELQRAGYQLEWQRVEDAPAMLAALRRRPWDLVISDYRLPSFSAPEALQLLQQVKLDIPFIIVSGTVGEDVAVAAMKAGAHDYLAKGHFKRLVPAVERELREAEIRSGRAKAALEFKRADERFRLLLKSIDDRLFTVDPKLMVTGVWGRWLQNEGRNEDDVVGKPVRNLFDSAPPSPHADAFARATAGEHVVYEWSDAAKAEHWLISLSPQRDTGEGVTGVVVLARDISAAKRMQSQLVLSDRLASVGMLAAGVAHEINNPLAVTLSNLDWLSRELGELRGQATTGMMRDRLEGTAEPVRDAREAAHRVREIVRDLKVFARGEEDNRHPVDVHGVLESSIRLAWNEVRHRARLVRKLDPVPSVLANESRLGQVFLNLLVNAAQAIEPGHADQHEITVTTRTEGTDAVIEVSDSGRGIPAEVRERLFTPFFTTRPVGEGTGLGLSICHRIVTDLGGDITAENPPRGALFRVRLPGTPIVKAPETKQEAPVTLKTRGKVLVIDDEVMVAHAVQRTLDRRHDVTVLTDGREALKRIKGGEQYDCLVCDLMMPHLTGMEFHAQLEAIAPDQAKRCVFLTGGAFTPAARSFLDSAKVPTLEKPFDTHKLLAAVEAVVRRGA